MSRASNRSPPFNSFPYFYFPNDYRLQFDSNTFLFSFRFGGVECCQAAYRTISSAGTNDLRKIRTEVCREIRGESDVSYPTDESMFLLSDDIPEPNVLVRGKIESGFNEFVQDLVDSFGEQMPHMLKQIKSDSTSEQEKNRVFIPVGLFRDRMEVFREMKKAGVVPQKTSFQWLYTLWERNFSWVSIKKWIPFCKCQQCTDLLNKLVMAKTAEERSSVKQSRTLHRMSNALTRHRLTLRYSLADAFPMDVLSITIDGMDNTKTQHPVLGRVSKDIDNTGKQLHVKLTGVLIRGLGFYGAWSLPIHATGSSFVCTVLLRSLLMLEDRFGSSFKLPPVLLLQMDNCGRENKNQFMIRFLSLLIHMDVFVRVELHFLPVGHTHCQIDQLFSVIYRAMKGKDLFTVPESMALVDTLFPELGFSVNELVTDIIDVSTMLDDVSHKIVGLGTVKDPLTGEKKSLHSLRLEKDRSGKVVLFYKEHDEMSKWLGHWKFSDRGIRVFKDNFSTVPPLLPGNRTPMQDLSEVEKHVKCVLECYQVERKQAKQTPSVSVATSGTSTMTTVGSSTAPSMRTDREQRISKAEDWWKELIDNEKSFWATASDKDSSPFPSLSYASRYPTTRHNRLQLIKRAAYTGLQFLDSPLLIDREGLATHASPPFGGPESRPWVDLSRLELEVRKMKADERRRLEGKEGRRDIFVCHANDRPPQSERYDPKHDAHEGHIGIAQVYLSDSTFHRGWELVRIDSDPFVDHINGQAIDFLKLTYLQPCRLRRGAQAWPENWASRTYEPMHHPVTRRPWTEAQFPCDNIVWSTEPKLNAQGGVVMQVPVALQDMMMDVVQMVVEWHKDHRNPEGFSNIPYAHRSPQAGDGEDED